MTISIPVLREGMLRNHCYRNWTGTRKTGLSNQFIGLAGLVSKKNLKTKFFSKPGTKPAETGQNQWNWPVWIGES